MYTVSIQPEEKTDICRSIDARDVIMNDNSVFSGEKISELVIFIINKFAKEGLTSNKAEVVLQKTKEALGDFSMVNTML